jgi:hypothetical protein
MKFQWVVPVENIIGKVPLVPVGDTGTVLYCISFPGAYGVADRAPATDAGCGTSTCGLWAGPVTYRPGGRPRPAPAVPGGGPGGKPGAVRVPARRGAGAARAKSSPAADQAPSAQRAGDPLRAPAGGRGRARGPPTRPRAARAWGAARRGLRLNQLRAEVKAWRGPLSNCRRAGLNAIGYRIRGSGGAIWARVRGHCGASGERAGIYFCE